LATLLAFDVFVVVAFDGFVVGVVVVVDDDDDDLVVVVVIVVFVVSQVSDGCASGHPR
jgi:hypothetical protein